jgi:tetratricopeptide (TPR) repeat protein
MYKETVGMDHLGTAGAFQRLAEVHLEMGEVQEALACAQQALTIRKGLLGQRDEATGDSYFVIGKIFFTRMDLDTSRPCLEAALEVFREHRGNNHVSVADAMYFIGCIHGKLRVMHVEIMLTEVAADSPCPSVHQHRISKGLGRGYRLLSGCVANPPEESCVETIYRLPTSFSNWE